MMSGVSAFATPARFSSIPNDSGLPAWFGSDPPWMCHAGFVGRSASACVRARSALAIYSSTARGMASKYSRLARCGWLYMNCDRDSGGAYFSQSSTDSPLPLDLLIFCACSSRKSSYVNPSGGGPPRMRQIRPDRRTESIKSLPDIS